MKRLCSIVAAALFLGAALPPAQAAPNVSVDFFYDQLGDYGDWVEVGDYGYGWQPRDVDEGWRPYSDGRWAYTDAGWTWLSEEPYGWAVYHYGRWARIEHKGWVWIPGTEWAPAWVSWRRSPQHVGWAPLPPEASFRRSVGFSGSVDAYYDIGPGAYRFVEVRNFGAPRLHSVFVDPRENITIISHTTNITRITYANSIVNNGGPRYEDISRESADPIRRLRLDRRVEIEGDRSSFRGEQMRSRVEGDSLRIFAPAFDARAAAPPQKLSAKIEKAEINRGWTDAGPAADVEKLRAKVRGEAKAPKGLPPEPKFEKLAEQTAAPEVQPTKEKRVAAAPGEKPRGEKLKDGREGKDLPIAPVAPPVESKIAPLENPVAPEAPMKPQKPGKTGRAEKVKNAEAPGQPPGAPGEAEAKPEKAVPPTAEPVNPERKGKNLKQLKPLPPKPVESVEPKVKTQRPEALRKLPPEAERPAPRNERAFPPEPAPRRDAPKPPKNEPRKPQMERPDSARQVPPAVERSKPKSERPNPPKVAPAQAPEPAPHGEAPKAKPGKGKAKDEKKPDSEAPKSP